MRGEGEVEDGEEEEEAEGEASEPWGRGEKPFEPHTSMLRTHLFNFFKGRMKHENEEYFTREELLTEQETNSEEIESIVERRQEKLNNKISEKSRAQQALDTINHQLGTLKAQVRASHGWPGTL